jgi:hypothetical protein
MIAFLEAIGPLGCLIVGGTLASIGWLFVVAWYDGKLQAARLEASQLRIRQCACRPKSRYDNPFRQVAASGYYVRDRAIQAEPRNGNGAA